jgi:hypothetical protein
MGFEGYVAVCVQLCCRCYTVLHLVSLFKLHFSAYMAIFRCVGYFIFVFLKEILYTNSQYKLVLSSTIAWRYYKCSTDGSISLENYRYHIVERSHLLN